MTIWMGGRKGKQGFFECCGWPQQNQTTQGVCGVIQRDGNNGVAKKQRTFNIKKKQMQKPHGTRGNLQRPWNLESTDVYRWDGEHRDQSITRIRNRTVYVAGHQPTIYWNQEQHFICSKMVNILVTMRQLFPLFSHRGVKDVFAPC